MVAPARGASDRYEILLKLASGGMGSVYIARMRGALGFRQLVAIKKPHSHLLEDAKARLAVVHEAKLTSAIRHVNVVTMRDVDHHDGEVALVMDYVEGGSIIDLLRDAPAIPPAIAIRMTLDACAGLHAAHEAKDDAGVPLSIVHRDVSPHNILVGTDGLTRVTDFGIAKSLGRGGEGQEASTSGGVKGKLAYMAPEYLQGNKADRRVDVFALGAVLWEAIEGKRLFRAGNDLETLTRLLQADTPQAERAGPAVNAILRRALAKAPEVRFQTADEMAEALDRAAKADGHVATHRDVAAFVKERVGPALDARIEALKEAHRKRQQTTGSMSAIVVASPPAQPDSEEAPPSLSRTSATIDLGAVKGAFAATDSGLTPSQTPEAVEQSTTANVPRGPKRSVAGLLGGVIAAALFGSGAAFVAWKVTLPPQAARLEREVPPDASAAPPAFSPTLAGTALAGPSAQPTSTGREPSPTAAPSGAPSNRQKGMRIPQAVTVSTAAGTAPIRPNPYETPSAH